MELEQTGGRLSGGVKQRVAQLLFSTQRALRKEGERKRERHPFAQLAGPQGLWRQVRRGEELWPASIDGFGKRVLEHLSGDVLTQYESG